MKNQAQVEVNGGGVVDALILYPLSKLGCHDAIMLERSELMSYSAWHATGAMHTINGVPNVTKLQQYTIKLYQEIKGLLVQNIGLHITGGIVFAVTGKRFGWLKSVCKYLGMDDLEIITSERAHELVPLINPSQFVGATYDPIEGQCNPYGVNHDYAKATRKMAWIERPMSLLRRLFSRQVTDGSSHPKKASSSPKMR